jgi:hypothetical protein
MNIMRQSSSRRLLDILVLVILLGGAAFVMYSLLPQRTATGQAVVPSLPASAFDPAQAFLTVFITMTAVGAPVTGAIVLALILKGVSKSIPLNAATPDRPIEKRPAPAAPKELSKGEALLWKIVATVLILIVIGILAAAIWPSLQPMFS